LELLNLKEFELLTEGEDYLVRGNIGTPPSWRPLELRYTPEDIDQLERAGQAKRRDPHAMPRPYSVSQILRVIGDYLDYRGGRLLELSRQRTWVTIHYETEQGQRKEEPRLDSFIYDLFVHMYLQRGRRL
jgi:hypothetical protein